MVSDMDVIVLKWVSAIFAVGSPIMALFLAYSGLWLSAITWVVLTFVWVLNYRNCNRSIESRKQIDKRIEEMMNDYRN
jgi:membrane protein implicated in regulation of membrane protease activity